jgi:prevent-host-death family protein
MIRDGQVTSWLCYDERMDSRLVSATEFKAKCLALLDEIGRDGGTITVTKRGRPMATVGPVRKRLWPSSEGLWAGKVHIPEKRLTAGMSDLWDVVRKK